MNGIQTHMYMPLLDRDQKMGGLTGVLVGYIEERKTFIMATTFGSKYGSSGYVFVPYQYILDKRLTMELYVMDFQKDRVESYILQRKKMTELETTELKLSEKKYKRDDFGGLFR
jgi:C1A family cysteine protease